MAVDFLKKTYGCEESTKKIYSCGERGINNIVTTRSIANPIIVVPLP
jgi:hypothetical protein